MNSRAIKGGFTLIEIMVAMTIIVSIVSIVYGSYFATSKAVEAYRTRMAISGRAQKALRQIARQIRCAYASSTELLSQQENKESEGKPDYFNGDSDDPGGEILYMVTTNAMFKDRGPSDGLFEVTYRLDKSAGLLSINQQRFVGRPISVGGKGHWQPIIGNVEFLELKFFDGKRWLRQWNFEDNGELPCAVKIDLALGDGNCRVYRYGTVANIYGQNNQAKKSLSDN